LETKNPPIQKKHLQDIADNVNENTSVEDVFEQLLIDIEKSENEIEQRLVFSQNQVKEDAKTWLR